MSNVRAQCAGLHANWKYTSTRHVIRGLELIIGTIVGFVKAFPCSSHVLMAVMPMKLDVYQAVTFHKWQVTQKAQPCLLKQVLK